MHECMIKLPTILEMYNLAFTQLKPIGFTSIYTDVPWKLVPMYLSTHVLKYDYDANIKKWGA